MRDWRIQIVIAINDNYCLLLLLLKGNEALEKNFFFFFSKARKYGEEIKIKKK